MLCRFCEKPLIKGEDKKFETLCDHVSDPNAMDHPLRPTYVCEDPECIANSKAKGFWDDYGDFYSSHRIADPHNKYGHNSALNSFGMKMEVEVYKDDENFYIWRGFKYRLKIKYKYKANEMGEIIKRTPTLEIHRRDFSKFTDMFFFWDWRRNDWIGHHTNFHMLKYCKESYLRNLSEIGEAVKEGNLERALRYVEKEYKDRDYYKKWGHQSKPWHMVWRHWEWYRPAFSRWLENRYFEDDNVILDAMISLKYKNL